MERLRLEYLFHAYFSKTASASEKEELMRLLLLDENSEQLDELLAQAWQRLQSTDAFFTEAQGEQLFTQTMKQATKATAQLRIQQWRWLAAAAILLVFAAGAWLWLNQHRSATPIPAPQTMVASVPQDVAPGSNKATLTLADGSAITLDEAQKGVLAQQGTTRVMHTGDGTLAYQPAAHDQAAPVLYNTLSIPRGGQYKLVLPDGTKVWMNSSSSLRFPAAFTGKERRIELTGEAYFEVTHDAAHPFTITVGWAGSRFNVDVLGTHVNVMAYEDEGNAHTTLLEGRVKVSGAGSAQVLSPGEQARISKNNHTAVSQADTDEVMAWKNGDFLFTGYGVEQIMRQLSRWYDVDVVYEGKVPDGHFSGIVNRNNNISQVLKILEAGGVRFAIDGKKIIVKSTNV